MSLDEARPLVAIDRVSYTYPGQSVTALAEVSLTLRRGCATGLLGPNGSGKTTLISLIAGLRAPASGQVRFAAESACTVAYVPQDFAFYPDLTCRENLEFFSGMIDSGAERSNSVSAAIADCRLEEIADRRAKQCSGGMKRRLNLAIALLQRPTVLLLDEPTVGVDPQTRVFLLERIRALVHAGTAVLYASHYMQEIAATCSQLLLLDHGRVLASGGLDELLAGKDGVGPFADLEALFMHYTRRSLRA